MRERLAVTEDEHFGMANFSGETTGLRHRVWLCGIPVGKHDRPLGRIKAGGRFYPFSVDEPVEWLVKPAPGVSAGDFADLTRFMEINRATILGYWNDQISTEELIARLRPIHSLSSTSLLVGHPWTRTPLDSLLP